MDKSLQDEMAPVFSLGTQNLMLGLAYQELLLKVAVTAGDNWPAVIEEIEQAVISGVKNMTPTPNVPDDVWLQVSNDCLSMFAKIFSDVRGKITQ